MQTRSGIRWLFLISLVFPLTLQGMTVLALNLEQMTRQADRIFVGHCLGLETSLDEHGYPATYVRFEVTEAVKGVDAGETLLIKQFGTDHLTFRASGGEKVLVPLKSLALSPKSYSAGSEYLLFLYPDSSLGFTSPVGGGQGRFDVLPEAGAHGERLVRNALGTQTLRLRQKTIVMRADSLESPDFPLDEVIRQARRSLRRSGD